MNNWKACLIAIFVLTQLSSCKKKQEVEFIVSLKNHSSGAPLSGGTISARPINNPSAETKQFETDQSGIAKFTLEIKNDEEYEVYWISPNYIFFSSLAYAYGDDHYVPIKSIDYISSQKREVNLTYLTRYSKEIFFRTTGPNANSNRFKEIRYSLVHEDFLDLYAYQHGEDDDLHHGNASFGQPFSELSFTQMVTNGQNDMITRIEFEDGSIFDTTISINFPENGFELEADTILIPSL